MRQLRFLLGALLAGCTQGSIALPDFGANGNDQSVIITTNEVSLGDTSTLTPCLAVDSTNAYFVEELPDNYDLGSADMKGPQDGGVARMPAQLRRVALTDGTSTILATNADAPGCAVVDPTGIYYTSADKIIKLDKTTNAATTVTSGQRFISNNLVVANGYLYWISDVLPGSTSPSSTAAILRISTAGTGLALADGSLTGVPIPGALAADATNVYYSDQSGVWARPLGSPMGTRVQYGLTDDSVKGSVFAVDATHVATVDVVNVGVGEVGVEGLNGMGRVRVSASLASTLVIDSSGVYANQGAHLVRFALDGSTTTTIADRTPQAIALDATNIFFLTNSGLYRIAK